MNPLRWVRWKVVLTLLVLSGLAYLLGIDALACWRVNLAGDENPRARWSIEQVDLALLLGDLDFEKIAVAATRRRATPPPTGTPGSKERVLSAAAARIDLSVKELLRRRLVVEEVKVEMPSLTIVRRPDGSTNVDDLSPETPDEAESAAGDEKQPADWLESAIGWYEKIQTWRERLAGSENETRDRAERKATVDYYARRVEYPFNRRPNLLINRLVASDLEVRFLEEVDGEAEATPLPRLRGGMIEIFELSNRPTTHEHPVGLKIEGELGDERLGWARLALHSTLDVTGRETPSVALAVRVEELPAAVIESFVGRSLPVRLVEGQLGLDVSFRLSLEDGAGRFLQALRPKLRFHGMRLEAEDPEGRIAGVPARDFVSTFNDAAEALDAESTPLVIEDLEISGSLSSPRFAWGDTLKSLGRQVGEAIARREAARIEGQLKDEIGRGIDSVLEGTSLGDDLKPLDGVLPGGAAGTARESAHKGVDLLREGFPGSRRDEPDEK